MDSKRYASHHFNKVIVLGKCILPPKPLVSDKGEPWTFFTLQHQAATPDGKLNKATSFRILTKCWGASAKKAISDLHQGDVVLIEGHLGYDGFAMKSVKSDTSLGARGVVCLHTETLRILFSTDYKFRREHVQIPMGRLRRLLQLERHHDPEGTWVCPEALDRYSTEELAEEDF